jgi:hypothetical protein
MKIAAKILLTIGALAIGLGLPVLVAPMEIPFQLKMLASISGAAFAGLSVLLAWINELIRFAEWLVFR